MSLKRALQITLAILVLLPVGLVHAGTPTPTKPDSLPMTDPKLISKGVSNGYNPTIAYNTQHEEYLVVYDNLKDIYAQRVSSRGELLGDQMTIADHANDEGFPMVAYDSTRDRFLVVWHRDSGSGHLDIYGRFIPWNGPISGLPVFVIDNTTNNTQRPQIAFGLAQDEYMVIWTHDTGGWPEYEIDGVRVKADNTGIVAIPDPHVASHVNENRQNPDITYNLAKNEYFIVYDDTETGTNNEDILGVIMAGNGSKLHGGEFGIAEWGNDEFKPAVAACRGGVPNIGQYLVAWVTMYQIDRTTWEPRIYAYYLDGNKNFGGVYMIDNVLSNFPYSEIDIACRWGTQYMMVWEHKYTVENKIGVWSRMLFSDESMWSSVEVQKPTSESARGNMAVANGDQQFLVVWEQRDASNYADIYGRILGDTPPIADFTFTPSSGPIDTTFQFDASTCSDFETATADLEVRWDWGGEGNYDTAWSKTKTASHQFHSPGNKLVRLQVKDSFGLLVTAEKIVQVGNTSPTADFTISPEVGDNTTNILFDASPSHDLEDPTSVLQVCWDWDNDSTCDTPWDTQKTAGHVFVGATYGTITVRLSVKDTGGLTGATTKYLKIDNKPTASFTISPTSGDTNTTFTFDASGTTDPDINKNSLYMRWDWEDDGNYDTAWINDVVLNKTTHRFSKAGTYTVRLEVREPEPSLSDTTTRQVKVDQATSWFLYLPYIAPPPTSQ